MTLFISRACALRTSAVQTRFTKTTFISDEMKREWSVQRSTEWALWAVDWHPELPQHWRRTGMLHHIHPNRFSTPNSSQVSAVPKPDDCINWKHMWLKNAKSFWSAFVQGKTVSRVLVEDVLNTPRDPDSKPFFYQQCLLKHTRDNFPSEEICAYIFIYIYMYSGGQNTNHHY